MRKDAMKAKIIQNENQLEHTGVSYLAKNLSTLLQKHYLTAARLAQILGISVMAVRRLLSGETADPRISTLKLIADHFNISVDSLMTGSDSLATLSPEPGKPLLLPVFDWQTAEKLTGFKNSNLSHWKEWQPIAHHEKNFVSDHTFALKSRPSLYPRFPQGAIFIINPDILPTDGDIVLIKIIENHELTLRQLTIDPPEWKLHPMVAGSSVLHYTKQEHEIIGVNVLTMLYHRQ
jgi:transcriptional regulator with XRE-family HTH domain